MRFLQSAIAFFLGVMLSSYVVLSHAETHPATMFTEYAINVWSPSKAAACSAYLAVQPSSGTGGCGSDPQVTKQYVYAVTSSDPTCDFTTTIYINGGQCFSSPSSLGYSSRDVLSCPASGGWTLDGSVCVRADCPVGTLRNEVSGSCDLPACPTGQTRGSTGTGSCQEQCPADGAESSATGQVWAMSSSSSNMSVIMPNGCQYRLTNVVCGYGSGSSCFGTIGTSTGQSASPTTYSADGVAPSSSTPGVTAATPTSAESSCYNQGKCPVTINGTVTCSQCATSQSVNVSTSTAADNTVTQTTTTTTTTYGEDGIRTATTVEKATTPPGGPTTTETTSNSGNTSKGTFCTQNPGDPVCKAFKSQCELTPEAAGCKELGDAPVVDAPATESVGPSSITPVNVTGAAGCPADVQLPHGAVFSWQPTCDFASGLRPIVLAIAWLSAGLIVFGGLRNG